MRCVLFVVRYLVFVVQSVGCRRCCLLFGGSIVACCLLHVVRCLLLFVSCWLLFFGVARWLLLVGWLSLIPACCVLDAVVFLLCCLSCVVCGLMPVVNWLVYGCCFSLVGV